MCNSILDLRALRIENLVPLRAFEDGTFFAEAGGEGPAEVLALHGWGRRGSDFATSLEGLNYLAIDLPGFGASPPPAEPTGARGYADTIKASLDQLSARPILVGHSFGGRVAVALAATHPGRFGGVVLSGVPLLRRASARSPLPFRLARWAAKRGMLSAKLMESLRKNYGSADYRAASGVMREVLVIAVNESYESELREISAPVCLVWGADDSDAPVTMAQAAASTMRGAGITVTVKIVEGVGHFLPLESPESIRAAIEEMLVP